MDKMRQEHSPDPHDHKSTRSKKKRKVAKAFPKFSKLPETIRHQIWSHAAAVPRTVGTHESREIRQPIANEVVNILSLQP